MVWRHDGCASSDHCRGWSSWPPRCKVEPGVLAAPHARRMSCRSRAPVSQNSPLPYLAEFHQFLRSSAIHARSSASAALASDAVTRTSPAEVFLAFTVLARMSLAVTLAIFGFRCRLRRTFDAWHAGSAQYHSEWCLNANRSPQPRQRLSCRPPIQITTQPTLSRTSIANASLSGKTLTQAALSGVPNQSSALSQARMQKTRWRRVAMHGSNSEPQSSCGQRSSEMLESAPGMPGALACFI